MPKYYGGQEYRQRPKQTTHVDSFSAALSGIANAIEEQQRKKQDEELIEKMSNEDLTQMERAQLALKLSPQGQKAVTTALDLYYKLQRQQELQQRHQEEIDIRREREERLKGQNSSKDLERSYKARLSDLKDQIKDTYNSKDKKALLDEQKALQKELGQNIARLKKGEKPRFDVLQIEQDALPVQRQGFDTMNQMGGPNANIPGATPGINPYAENSFTPNVARNATALRQPAGKARWDKTNPEHQAFASKVYQETGGDRAKANAILAEQFER